MTGPAVEFEQVTLALPGRTVLQNVSLQIDAGQFVGVLGPNGAGKTTLMRALLGLLQPAAACAAAISSPVPPTVGAGANPGATRRCARPWTAPSKRSVRKTSRTGR